MGDPSFSDSLMDEFGNLRDDIVDILNDMYSGRVHVFDREDLIDQILSEIKDSVENHYDIIKMEHANYLENFAYDEMKRTEDYLRKNGVSVPIKYPPEDEIINLYNTTFAEDDTPTNVQQEWERNEESFLKTINNQITEGIRKGVKVSDIVGKFNGEKEGDLGEVFGRSLQESSNTLINSLKAVKEQSRFSLYKANPDIVAYVEWKSVIGDTTTDDCKARHEKTWTLDGDSIDDDSLPFKVPPTHWGCRSRLVPVIHSAATGTPVPVVGVKTSAAEEAKAHVDGILAQLYAKKPRPTPDQGRFTVDKSLFRDQTNVDKTKREVIFEISAISENLNRKVIFGDPHIEADRRSKEGNQSHLKAELKIKPRNGEYVLSMHTNGDKGFFAGKYAVKSKRRELFFSLEEIKKELIDSGWDEKTPIRFYGCAAGKYKDGPAQQLANFLGVKVYAPTTDVYVDSNGKALLEEKIEDKNGNIKIRKGKWRPFLPSNKI